MEYEGCPGSRMYNLNNEEEVDNSGRVQIIKSQLKQWPIQLHLISPQAPYYKNSDLLLAADCTGFSFGNFHNDFLKGKSIAIACPKLDDGKDIYVEKIQSLIENSMINTITVLIMQVPCCGGLLSIAKKALENSKRKIPIKCITLSLDGKVLEEEWV